MGRALFLLLAALPFIAAATAPGGGSSTMGVPRTPRINYALHCQGCHLPDGSGTEGKVPALRGHLARFLSVRGGREYIVQVPGVSTSKLNDADTAALMNWLVREMGPRPPDDFRPYTQSEVAALRARWLNRPGPVRARLQQTIDRLPSSN